MACMTVLRALRRFAATVVRQALPLLLGACATTPSTPAETLLRDDLIRAAQPGGVRHERLR